MLRRPRVRVQDCWKLPAVRAREEAKGNPKPEIRDPKEIRKPKSEGAPVKQQPEYFNSHVDS
jgi:hypothetical protein